MEDKKEELVKYTAEIKELRAKEDEVFAKIIELLEIEKGSYMEYHLFYIVFNDGSLDEFWEKYLNEK